MTEKHVECLCGTDAALARGEQAFIRFDVVCPKHDGVVIAQTFGPASENRDTQTFIPPLPAGPAAPQTPREDGLRALVEAMRGEANVRGASESHCAFFLRLYADKLNALLGAWPPAVEADVAQVVEQPVCNRQGVGSTPTISSTLGTLEQRVISALKLCIDAHGPITKYWVGSAAKRVLGELTSRASSPSPSAEYVEAMALFDARPQMGGEVFRGSLPDRVRTIFEIRDRLGRLLTALGGDEHDPEPSPSAALREALAEALTELEDDNTHTLKCCAQLDENACICGRDERVARWKAALLGSTESP